MNGQELVITVLKAKRYGQSVCTLLNRCTYCAMRASGQIQFSKLFCLPFLLNTNFNIFLFSTLGLAKCERCGTKDACAQFIINHLHVAHPDAIARLDLSLRMMRN